MKNLLLLGMLTFAAFAYAKTPAVQKSSIDEAEKYKVTKPVAEKNISRSFAGSKAKRDVDQKPQAREEVKPENSEVQYWQYSE